MDKKVRIYCKNTSSFHDFEQGISLLEIYKKINIKLKYQVVAARVNYKVEDLNFLVYKPKDIEFIDSSIPSGMRVYVRSLSMVLAKAIDELFPHAILRIEHPISKGYYCKIENLGEKITPEIIEKIKEKINEIIRSKKAIHCEEKQTQEVKKLFAAANQPDKIALLESIGTPYCRYFRIDDFIDYYAGVLLPSTDYLVIYDLIPYYSGFLLRIPSRENPVVLEELVEQNKMHEIYREYVSWNKIMGLSNVGDLNILLKQKKAVDIINVSEALHEKKVARCADMILHREEKPKLILISGPSSSGKTTFSKRLSVQLLANGIKPLTLSLDNYFVDREKTPLDKAGNFDFEHLHALDLDLFNQQLKQLFAGETVEIPNFNFEKGRRVYRGETLTLKEHNILILEGIHALNPELIPDISHDLTFKIYVSALTTTSIDNHNWISTADLRLIRRIIRDSQYRNYSARETISRWDSVREGENKWIFPFQENADLMFNSALLFELAVLKNYAEPRLQEVPKYCNEYTEAYRLLKFLNYFVPITDKEIPPTSLLREFVGGSSFNY